MHFARRITARILIDYGYSIFLCIRWLIFAIIWTRKFFLGLLWWSTKQGLLYHLGLSQNLNGDCFQSSKFRFFAAMAHMHVGLLDQNFNPSRPHISKQISREAVYSRQISRKCGFLSANRYSCRISWKILHYILLKFSGIRDCDDDCGMTCS